MSLTSLPETIEWFPYVELGEVEQAITTHQRGRVRFMATSWFARFYQPNGQTEVLPGTTVKVIGRQGLTLLVILVDEDVQAQVLAGDRSKSTQSKWLHWLQQAGSAFGSLLG
jgi:hypothetical protein